MMATRRRTAQRVTRATPRPQPSPIDQALGAFLTWMGSAWAELTDDQREDVYGIGLMLSGAAVLASMIWPGPWLLAGIHGLTFWLVGYGWPMLAGALLVGGYLLAKAVPVKRLQVIALLAAGVAILGLVSLASGPAGGSLGSLVASLLSSAISGVGAGILLVLVIVGGMALAWPGRLAKLARLRGLRERTLGQAMRTVASAGPVTDLVEVPRQELVSDPPRPVAQAPAGVVTPTPPAAVEFDDDEPEEVVRPTPVVPSARRWNRPGIELLEAPKPRTRRQEAKIASDVATIETKLGVFGIAAHVADVHDGPSFTRYVVEIAHDVPVKKVEATTKDLALALAATTLRIEAPIPGLSAVGIEVPKKIRDTVTLRGLIEDEGLAPTSRALPVAIGSDVAGRAVLADLATLPHLLLGGTTGSGKSVVVNSLICSLLMRHTPATLRLVLVDPKRVELGGYDGIPHLAFPVILDPVVAVEALRWAEAEMKARYRLLSTAGVRNITAYNERQALAGGDPMPFYVIVIDELADLMMVAKSAANAARQQKEAAPPGVEEVICSIAQMARAVGIHLVLATQRPSVDVVTGLIKANVPSRLALKVAAGVDSRTIIDSYGAEKLMGKGDMLWLPVDADGGAARLQAPCLSDPEIDRVVGFWRRQGKPEYVGTLGAPALPEPSADADRVRPARSSRLDPLFARVARDLVREGSMTNEMLQAKYQIPSGRASLLLVQLTDQGVIGSKAGEVRMTGSDVDDLLAEIGAE